MDAVTAINKHIDVMKLLEHYEFEGIHQEGDLIRACCKIHGGKNPTSFVINEENGLYYCHTDCHSGGDIYTLVQKMENIDFESSVAWLAEFYKIDINNLQIKERECNYVSDLKNFIKLMKERREKEIKTFTIKEEIKEVTKYRSFKEETLKHFKLGYVENVLLEKRDGTSYTLYHRLVFPIIFNSIQVGISFRKTKAKDFPKWSHQPVSIETKNILYNYDAVKFEPTIIVCEGFLDVWAFHEIGLPSVSTFGAHITKEQYKLLLKTGASLVFAFDGDEAGQKATQQAIEMFRNKVNMYVLPLNDGEDPENILREELKKRYGEKRRKF